VVHIDRHNFKLGCRVNEISSVASFPRDHSSAAVYVSDSDPQNYQYRYVKSALISSNAQACRNRDDCIKIGQIGNGLTNKMKSDIRNH